MVIYVLLTITTVLQIISSIVTKIFESCILYKFCDFFSSHDLQFGFKKGFGCNAAIFSMQQVVKYFTDRVSCVYLSALDATKAFDRINHSKLIDKPRERNFPACVINTIYIANWYSVS